VNFNCTFEKVSGSSKQSTNISQVWTPKNKENFIKAVYKNRKFYKQFSHVKRSRFLTQLRPCHTRHLFTTYCDKKDIVIKYYFEPRMINKSYCKVPNVYLRAYLGWYWNLWLKIIFLSQYLFEILCVKISCVIRAFTWKIVNSIWYQEEKLLRHRWEYRRHGLNSGEEDVRWSPNDYSTDSTKY